MNIVERVSDNIYFLRRHCPSSNTTLIKGEVNILIDPGYNPKGNLSSLSPLFKEAKLTVKDIDEMWLTHNHSDHTQMAYFLLQEKDMRVVCHPDTKRIVEAAFPIRGLIELERESIQPILNRLYPDRKSMRGALEKLLSILIRFYVKPLNVNLHPIKITDTFRRGEKRYGIDIIFLPGHTPDEVGFFLKSTLITGDLIATYSFDRPAVLNISSSDIDDAISSMEKILSISPEWILPGHGGYSRIDRNIVNEIYKRTVDLREYGISIIKRTHSFFPFVIGLQKILPHTIRLQERLSLILIIYKSYMREQISGL